MASAMLSTSVTMVCDAARQLVLEIRRSLDERGIAFRVAEARDTVCDALTRAGGEAAVDVRTAKLSVAEALA